MRERAVAALLLVACAVLAPSAGHAASTAFRINSLAFRDPHLYFSFIGCRDVTDAPLAGFSFNGELQKEITTDSDGDSLLDLSDLIVFRPLDQGAVSGSLEFVSADCRAPMAGTHCVLGSGSVASFTYYNQPTGACLAPIAGTTWGYTPAIAKPVDNCFVTNPATVFLSLAGLPMLLRSARIGGVYVGAPATSITNGLIMGFLTETDANATILPASFPVVGGQPLSVLFPGGANNCSSHSDKDILDGVSGWWMYLNFTATAVPYDDGTTAVPPGAPMLRLGQARPNPFSGSVAVEYSLPVASSVRICALDLGGRQVARLVEGVQGPGTHTLVWAARDQAGADVPAGVYFIRAEALGRTVTRRVALLR